MLLTTCLWAGNKFPTKEGLLGFAPLHSERWKHKRAARDKGKQCEQPNREKALYTNIASPTLGAAKVAQQPLQPHVCEQHANVLEIIVFRVHMVPLISVVHQIFGSRSKYSSSSFEPPSPRPRAFSDSMNSIRSIHLTIL